MGKYTAWVHSNKTTHVVEEYSIQANDTGESKPETTVARFYVNAYCTKDMAKMRCHEYMEYLNIQQVAIEKAVKENTLATAVAQRIDRANTPNGSK